MMSENSASLFQDLLGSPAFVAALTEFVALETQIRTVRLRSLLRANNTAAALMVEGELATVEELPGLFAQHAKAHR